MRAFRLLLECLEDRIVPASVWENAQLLGVGQAPMGLPLADLRTTSVMVSEPLNAGAHAAITALFVQFADGGLETVNHWCAGITIEDGGAMVASDACPIHGEFVPVVDGLNLPFSGQAQQTVEVGLEVDAGAPLSNIPAVDKVFAQVSWDDATQNFLPAIPAAQTPASTPPPSPTGDNSPVPLPQAPPPAQPAVLQLAKESGFGTQTVVAPVSNLKLGDYSLTNEGRFPVTLPTIQVGLNGPWDHITNLSVIFGEAMTSVYATPGAMNTWTFTSGVLNPGEQVDVSIYGDVDHSITGSISTSLLVSGGYRGAGLVQTAGDNGPGTQLTGQTIWFGQGQFSATVDAFTPINQVVAGGQTVVAAKYKLTASVDSYLVKEVKISLGSALDSSVIWYASLWADGAQVGTSQTFNQTSNTVAYFTGLNLLVSANTNKVLTVELTLGVPSADHGNDGVNVKTTVTQVTVASATQGTQSTIYPNQSGNDVIVDKSFPVMIPIMSPANQGSTLSGGGTVTLYAFSAAADPAGAIAFKQFAFNLLMEGGLLSNFRFFVDGTDITSAVHIRDEAGRSIEQGGTVVSGDATVHVTFDTEEDIFQGTTRTFSLTAQAAGFAYGNWVSVSLPVDQYPLGPLYLAANSNVDVTGLRLCQDEPSNWSPAVVIWSDLSASIHSYMFNMSSKDWFNGFYVLDLPLDTEGITAS